MPIRVESEIGRLRRVLVHRPGREIDWMVPTMMESLLFDDILDGDEAREEHDVFRAVLRAAGVEVLEVETLLADAIKRKLPTASNGGDLLIDAADLLIDRSPGRQSGTES